MEKLIEILLDNYEKKLDSMSNKLNTGFNLYEEAKLKEFLNEVADEFLKKNKNVMKTNKTIPNKVLKKWSVVVHHNDPEIKNVYKSSDKVEFLSGSILKDNMKAQFHLLAYTRQDVFDYIRENIENTYTITII